MKDDFSNRTKVTRHTHCDVIFGRGNGISSWPGNVAFRHIVWKYRPRYADANRSDKRNIGLIVTLDVQRLNGRFLVLNPKTGHFHRVSEKRAQDKACQGLREKDVKMPLGFDLEVMASRKKWLQSIIDHHQSSEGKLNPKQTPTLQLTEGKLSPKQTPSKQLTEGKSSSKQTPTGSKQLPERKSTSKQTLTAATVKEIRMTRMVTKISQPATFSRSGARAISSSVLTNKHSSGVATNELRKQPWCCEPPVVLLQDNRTIHVEDLSSVILDQTAHSSSRPFSGASSLSNHSMNGYGDDNTVLFDSNHWPEQDDPVA